MCVNKKCAGNGSRGMGGNGGVFSPSIIKDRVKGHWVYPKQDIFLYTSP
jgi:hypothetical protein